MPKAGDVDEASQQTPLSGSPRRVLRASLARAFALDQGLTPGPFDKETLEKPFADNLNRRGSVFLTTSYLGQGKARKAILEALKASKHFWRKARHPMHIASESRFQAALRSSGSMIVRPPRG